MHSSWPFFRSGTGFTTQSLTFQNNFMQKCDSFCMAKTLRTGLQNPSGSESSQIAAGQHVAATIHNEPARLVVYTAFIKLTIGAVQIFVIYAVFILELDFVQGQAFQITNMHFLVFPLDLLWRSDRPP